jgi:glycosyltransferase involved in cell wall biosynthesis
VIIPTHNRVESLLRTIRAFDRQNIDPDLMEIIVVADGCDDGTERVFDDHRTRYSSRVLVQHGQGAAAARNRGAEHATGSILLFMDDDIEPHPHLVEAHLRAHEASPGRVVLGPYPPSRQGLGTFYHMRVRSWWESLFTEMSRPGHRFHYRNLVSGNLSLSAELYRQLGGFDPAIQGAGGEDYEFGARVIKAGVQIAYEPQAQAVHHQHETMTLSGSLRRAQQEGRANVIIGRLHPELKAELFGDFHRSRERYFRHLRYVVFRGRISGLVLAWLTLRSLPMLEALKMRRRWRKAVGAIHGYWYWRGVADACGSEEEFAEYMEQVPVAEVETEVHEVDLADGLEAVERHLDEQRPAGIQLRFGAYEVGSVLPVTLAEPLRAAHLRPMLAERFPFQMVLALAMRETTLASSRSRRSTEDVEWR